MINVRAVLVGLVAFPIVYVVGTFLVKLIVGHPGESPSLWLFIAPVFAVLLWLLPGIATGYLAKRSPLAHGVVLGAGSVLLTLIVLGVSELVIRFSDSLPVSLTIGFLVPVFLGSCIGAFIGHYLANRRNAP